MIIEFSLGNYRSFNEIQRINFRATGLVSEDKTVDANNIAEVSGQRLLKTVGVYGANASGKSNLLKGLQFFKRLIVSSLENETAFSNWFQPNKQVDSHSDHLGYFQIILLLNERKYRYGFTLTNDGIAAEWLYGTAEKNETFYFQRVLNEVKVNNEYFPEGVNIPYETKLRRDALFLTFCSSYNGDISGLIRDYFVDKLKLDIGYDYNNLETNLLVMSGAKQTVLDWLNEASLAYSDINVKKASSLTKFDLKGNIVSHNNLNASIEMGQVKLNKNVYNKEGQVVNQITMDLEQDESEGTQKYYSYIGQFFNKFINGGLFISDEIDSNFHPALLRKIIGMFNNPKINKANAQLLFTSHDTNLMSPEIMRRDQFYFTEKSPTDATVLYSLADLKGIRNNADFAKQYLAGYYGALPVLGKYIEEQSNPE
ncbi:MAG: ATP-binding protein [Chitinophagaceae bacterium]|nr:ATP-binding protein [Chitinophagaceae bacterium]